MEGNKLTSLTGKMVMSWFGEVPQVWGSRRWTYFQEEETGNQRQAEWTRTRSKGGKGARLFREMLNKADVCGVHTQSVLSEGKGQKSCGPSGSTTNLGFTHNLANPGLKAA